MFRIIFAMSVMLSFVGVEAQADWDTTRPSMKVAVVPFNVHGDTGQTWLGSAMQEGLATGMRQVSGVIVAGVAPADAAGATNLAKYAGADAVIFGSIQLVGEQIRVTGQIISIDTGESLGTLKSDGSLRNLFDIEDVLAARVERILMPPPASRATAGPAATLQVVGPTMGPGASRYFDGNLMAQITPPDRYRDEYDKYYYQSGNSCFYGGGYGGCWGGWGCGWASGCGVGCPVVATPVTGW
jgi:TolB-like protein